MPEHRRLDACDKVTTPQVPWAEHQAGKERARERPPQTARPHGFELALQFATYLFAK